MTATRPVEPAVVLTLDEARRLLALARRGARTADDLELVDALAAVLHRTAR